MMAFVKEDTYFCWLSALVPYLHILTSPILFHSWPHHSLNTVWHLAIVLLLWWWCLEHLLVMCMCIHAVMSGFRLMPYDLYTW